MFSFLSCEFFSKYLILQVPFVALTVGQGAITGQNQEGSNYYHLTTNEDDFCYDIFNIDQCLYLKYITNKSKEQNEDGKLKFEEEPSGSKNHSMQHIEKHVSSQKNLWLDHFNYVDYGGNEVDSPESPDDYGYKNVSLVGVIIS